MTIQLHLGDCLDVLAQLDADSIDTCVTDPPYGLEFMGKDWDHGVPGVHFWQETYRVLKPGAVLLAFGGTRTWHRLACAIEDAGFELRDTVCWLYGSGFPKSHDISKAIDRAAGAEREVVGEYSVTRDYSRNGKTGDMAISDGPVHGTTLDITAPATDAAALWDGWGTALKPAFEPIIVAMKPRDGTFAQNALRWGVAGLAIDRGRVATNGETPSGSGDRRGSHIYAQDEWTQHQMVNGGNVTPPSGRWPANVILSHAPGCRRIGTRRVKGSGHWPSARGEGSDVCGPSGHSGQDGLDERYATDVTDAWDCVPDCPVRMLDEQSGERPSGGANGNRTNGPYSNERTWNVSNTPGAHVDNGLPPSTGGASRFFVNLPPDACRFRYCAKASRSERNAGLEEFEERGVQRVGQTVWTNRCTLCGASRPQQETSCGKCDGELEREERQPPSMRNGHPTVKPLALMRYLVRLTSTPTGGVVLDPFMGSGTTGCACVLEGRDFVGIEMDADYYAIAEARIAATEPEEPEPVQLVLEVEA